MTMISLLLPNLPFAFKISLTCLLDDKPRMIIAFILIFMS